MPIVIIWPKISNHLCFYLIWCCISCLCWGTWPYFIYFFLKNLPLVFFINCINLHIQSFCLLWKVPGSMVSPPNGECRPAPGRVLWWQVWPLQGSCPPTPRSPCRWQTGHRTHSSELHPNCKTPSRVSYQIPSTWIKNNIMLFFNNSAFCKK